MRNDLSHGQLPIDLTQPNHFADAESADAKNGFTGPQAAEPITRYLFLSDIDPSCPDVATRLTALAEAMMAKQEASSDPFWNETSQGVSADAIAHVLRTETDASRRTLSSVRQGLLGDDPMSEKPDPKKVRRYLREIAEGSE